jgi:hypothetical protein
LRNTNNVLNVRLAKKYGSATGQSHPMNYQYLHDFLRLELLRVSNMAASPEQVLHGKRFRQAHICNFLIR